MVEVSAWMKKTCLKQIELTLLVKENNIAKPNNNSMLFFVLIGCLVVGSISSC